jgi:hypothetical protein
MPTFSNIDLVWGNKDPFRIAVSGESHFSRREVAFITMDLLGSFPG